MSYAWEDTHLALDSLSLSFKEPLGLDSPLALENSARVDPGQAMSRFFLEDKGLLIFYFFALASFFLIIVKMIADAIEDTTDCEFHFKREI